MHNSHTYDNEHDNDNNLNGTGSEPAGLADRLRGDARAVGDHEVDHLLLVVVVVDILEGQPGLCVAQLGLHRCLVCLCYVCVLFN